MQSGIGGYLLTLCNGMGTLCTTRFGVMELNNTEWGAAIDHCAAVDVVRSTARSSALAFFGGARYCRWVMS
jgi:hypothetical protein